MRQVEIVCGDVEVKVRVDEEDLVEVEFDGGQAWQLAPETAKVLGHALVAIADGESE